jgi:FkbH-like protein
LVWDLDETLWRGVLLEDEAVALRPEAEHVLRALDARGILSSIASRNDETSALAKLEELGVADYFLHPQVGWGTKVPAIRSIADALGFSLDAIAFIDDQPAERDEVHASFPEVRCFDAADLASLLDRPDFTPAEVTLEARDRRALYRRDLLRKEAEASFVGSTEAFLASLEMSLTIAPARDGDLARAAELTERTHQLNSTGYTYSRDELHAFAQDARYRVWIASLEDRYGDYGKIGLALVENEDADPISTIKLLLTSCRVISRGVGTIVLGFLLRRAQEEGRILRAELVPTSRNRIMHVAYRFAGFREIEKRGEVILLEHDRSPPASLPPYVRVR